MKSHLNSPIRRLPLALAICLPVLPLLLVMVEERNQFSPLFTDAFAANLATALAIAAFLGLLLMFIWRSRPLWLFAWLIPLTYLMLPYFQEREEKPLNLSPYMQIGQGSFCLTDEERAYGNGPSGSLIATQGTDIYCNDVYIGRSPLKATQDIAALVQPWYTPPKQSRVIFLNNDVSRLLYFFIPYIERPIPPEMSKAQLVTEEDYSRAGFQYFPCDALSIKDATESFQKLPVRYGFAHGRYWWRFERDHCTGIIGKQSGGQLYSPLSALWIAYPSNELRAQCLIQRLRHAHYVPDAAWTGYIRTHLLFLFDMVYAKGQRDSGVASALQHAIAEEYDIRDRMTQSEIDTAWGHILKDVDELGFYAPSPQSIAIDLLGERSTQTLTKLFREFFAFDSRLHSGQALYYGAAKCPLPELRDLAFYHAPSTFPILDNYQDPASERLLKEYLDNAFYFYAKKERFPTGLERLWKSDNDHHEPIPALLATLIGPARQALPNNGWLLSRAHSPFLQEGIWNYFAQTHDEWFGTFAEERLKDRNSNVDDLVGHLSKLLASRSESYTFLCKVPSVKAVEAIEHVLESLPAKNDTPQQTTRANVTAAVIYPLSRDRNPVFDELLCRFLREELANGSTGDIFESLITALVRCDTEKTRAALTELWKHNPTPRGANKPFRSTFTDLLARFPRFDLALASWPPLLKTIDEPALRLVAVTALARADTPEGWDTLKAWSADSADKEVAAAASHEIEQNALRDRQADDLIAGRIQPDDLWPPSTPYVWNGHDYVPES